MNRYKMKYKKLLSAFYIGCFICLSTVGAAFPTFAVEQVEDESTIELPAPELTRTIPGERQVTILWKSDSSANRYWVYQSEVHDDGTEEWVKIGETMDTSYTATVEKAGEKYRFTVAGKYDEGISDYDEGGIFGYAAPLSPNLTGVTANEHSLSCKWEMQEDADGYFVYRKEANTNRWIELTTIRENSTTQYTDGSVEAGKQYYYAVQAYVEVDGNLICSKMNEKGAAGEIPLEITRPTVVKMKSVKQQGHYLKVEWNSDKHADGYRVYRYSDDGEKTVCISITTKTSYLDKNVSLGTNYQYVARAFVLNDGKRVWGDYSKKNGISGRVIPDTPNVTKTAMTGLDRVKLYWNTNESVDGFKIARKQAGESGYHTIGYRRVLAFTDKKLAPGTKYYYKVRAYVLVNGCRVYGSWSKPVSYENYEYKYYMNHKMIPQNVDLPGITRTIYGHSGQNRELYAYTVGNGKKHMVLNFSIHAWEDHWDADGYELTRVAVMLLEKLSENRQQVEKAGWTVVVIPCANPDGYYNGYSHNGPGRCTTRRFNSSYHLVKGGVDLNRSFPQGFRAFYNSRNYTGSNSLMSRESHALWNIINEYSHGTQNVYFDVHGWTQQILTNRTGSGTIYRTMKNYFPSNTAGNNGGGGYASYYARSRGYDACLFEFPRNVTSHARMVNNQYDTKFVNAIWHLINNY